MNLQTAKHLIKGAISAQRAAGITVGRNDWNIHHPYNKDGEFLGWQQMTDGPVCALGCLVLQHTPNDFAGTFNAVNSVLGWNGYEIRAFVAGFDGDFSHARESEYEGLPVCSEHFELGRAIAAEVLK